MLLETLKRTIAMNDGPPLLAEPPVPPSPEPRRAADRRGFAEALSGFLALLFLDAILCLADDSSIMALQNHSLAPFRAMMALLTLLATVVIYVLLAMTPMIPKRLFLPLTVFHPLVGLVSILFLIYSFDRMQEVAWVISFCQVVLSLVIFCRRIPGIRGDSIGLPSQTRRVWGMILP